MYVTLISVLRPKWTNRQRTVDSRYALRKYLEAEYDVRSTVRTA